VKDRTITIEGLSPDEFLASLTAETEDLVFSGAPIVFQVGSARILGQFAVTSTSLVVELAQIDGGGEGVLPALGALLRRYGRSRGISQVEWFVYATHCAQPNLKLRRVLARRGFVVRDVPGKGECYYHAAALDAGP
jgi:hypothetical protein